MSLDEQIAELVMGWKWHDIRPHSQTGTVRMLVENDSIRPLDGSWSERDLLSMWSLPEYSTEPTAAWSVVEKMRAMGWRFKLDAVATIDNRFGESVLVYFVGPNGGESHRAYRADGPMPLAVCKAALAALAPAKGTEGSGNDE